MTLFTAWLRFVRHLFVAYALSGLAGAFLFVVAVTAYAFPVATIGTVMSLLIGIFIGRSYAAHETGRSSGLLMLFYKILDMVPNSSSFRAGPTHFHG